MKEAQVACPRCGVTGRVVADATILAILRPGHADALLAVERRFCGTPACPALYYGVDGQVVEKGAATVRVGVKETDDPVPLCYCFGHSRADVRRQVAERGDSDIPERISAEIRAGRCRCQVMNPSGACCLGEVKRVVAESKAVRAGATSSSSAAGRPPADSRRRS